MAFSHLKLYNRSLLTLIILFSNLFLVSCASYDKEHFKKITVEEYIKYESLQATHGLVLNRAISFKYISDAEAFVDDIDGYR